MSKKLIIGIAIALASVISVVAIIAISGNKNDNSCNHNESEWVIIEKSTCTHNGIKTLNCDKCGGKTEVIPATGHKWEPATCEQAKKCSYCLEEQGNPLGHDYDSKILKDMFNLKSVNCKKLEKKAFKQCLSLVATDV